ENSFERSFNSRIEAAFFASCRVEGHQPVHIPVCRGTPISTPRQSLQDAARARGLHARGSAVTGLADKQTLAAGRLSGALNLIRPADRNAGERRPGTAASQARPKGFFTGCMAGFDERHADQPFSGLDRNSKVHGARSASGAAPSASSSTGACRAAERNQLQALSIHTDFDVIGIARVTGNINGNLVLTINGEVAANRQPTTRAEREFVHTRI